MTLAGMKIGILFGRFLGYKTFLTKRNPENKVCIGTHKH